jgi:hypothetical protein
LKCDRCGMANPATVIFCRKCGVRLASLSQDASSTIHSLLASSVTSPMRMPAPQQDSFPSGAPRKRRQRGRVLAGLVLVLLVVAASVAFVLTRFSPSTASASQTLLAYCGALERGDYQQAYGQLSSTFQQHYSEEDFVFFYQTRKGVSSCVVTNASQGSSSASGTVLLRFVDSSSVTYILALVFENNAWKILGQSPG